MKSIILLVLSLYMALSLNAQSYCDQEIRAEKIEGYQNLYHYKNFYFSGQPTLELLQWLQEKEVTKIINLRTEPENEQFAETAFDEEKVAKEMGFEYISFPVSGSNYSSEKLGEFSALINDDQNIMIHCASANRVTNYFMAWLIKYKGCDINEAVSLGKSLRFTFPLEELIGEEVQMEISQ